jgi:thiol-disulfide isomerase/thioredoxin
MSVRTRFSRAIGLLSLALVCAAGNVVAGPPSVLRPWPASLATPAFAATDASGKQWTLADLRGKVVILNFWATWCSPCVEEVPALDTLANERAGQLVVLGINYKEASWTVDKFAQAHAAHYPLLLDKSGELFKRWTTGVMPTTILLGRDGKPRWRMMGPLDAGNRAFVEALDKLLAEPAPNQP